MRGICGLYNYDQRDDMTMPDGQVTVNHAEFGNSWKSSHTCDEDMPMSGILDDVCHTGLYYHKYAEETCQILKSGEIQFPILLFGAARRANFKTTAQISSLNRFP